VGPATVTPTHIKRCLLSIYLFCYAPITGSAIELLVSIKTCTVGEDCGRVLDIDFGISATSNEYWEGTLAATATIVVFTVLVPIFLAVKARAAIKRRDNSFALRIEDVGAWFDQADTDGSGALDEAEIRQVLERMYGNTTDRAMRTAMRECDTLGRANPRGNWATIRRGIDAVRSWQSTVSDGTTTTRDTQVTVSKAKFQRWFEKKCSEAADTPYDVLYGTTRPGAYYWFIEVLWLKTAINVLYVFGRAESLEWHVWMHALLGMSVSIMIFVRPYISTIDQRVETVALLALGGIAHIASLFTLGGMLDPEYLVLTVLLALVPLVTLVGLKAMEARQTKAAHKASRAARGRQAVGAVRWAKTVVRQERTPPPAEHDSMLEALESEGEEEVAPALQAAPPENVHYEF
jgi:hypothetical protein